MLPERKGLTLIDLDAIDDDNRYELIDGELYMLAAPAPVHMIISSRLLNRIQNYLGRGPCEAFHAPADVFLFNQPEDSSDDIHVVVQPDIFVVCDPKQIGERGFYGPPTLVVEILSPSTVSMDRLVKYFKYQQAGVKEYWIIDPKNSTIHVHNLRDGRYDSGETYTSVEILRSEAFPGLEIPLDGIFPAL